MMWKYVIYRLAWINHQSTYFHFLIEYTSNITKLTVHYPTIATLHNDKFYSKSMDGQNDTKDKISSILSCNCIQTDFGMHSTSFRMSTRTFLGIKFAKDRVVSLSSGI